MEQEMTRGRGHSAGRAERKALQRIFPFVYMCMSLSHCIQSHFSELKPRDVFLAFCSMCSWVRVCVCVCPFKRVLTKRSKPQVKMIVEDNNSLCLTKLYVKTLNLHLFYIYCIHHLTLALFHHQHNLTQKGKDKKLRI